MRLSTPVSGWEVESEGPPLQLPVIRGPFEHVHVDSCGPFETPVIDVRGKHSVLDKPVKSYVVCMIDYFIKAAELTVI